VPGDIFAPRPLNMLRTEAGNQSVQALVAKYAVVMLALAVTTWALWPVRETIGLVNIGLVFLIIVLGATLWAGQWAGILTAVLGFALFDFFLVPPYLTFAISDLHNILALFVFLGESVLISWLLSGAREQARRAAQRADDVSRLYEMSQAIIGARQTEDVLPAIARKVADVLDAGVCWILTPGADNQLVIRAQHPADSRQPSRDEMALASWVLWHGKDAGLTGQTEGIVSPFTARSLPEWASRAPGLFAPLRVGERTIGVLGVADKHDGQPFTVVERTILNTLADQAAVALERLRLLREAERAEILARTDELKSALVSAVSHDLRTPVASMMALVTGLLDPDAHWDKKTQREFHQIIYDELVRLNRLVGNLLDMSRIEGGALRPEKGWYSIGEVIQSVAERLEPRLANHPLSVEVDQDMPLALFDFTEIDQVLTNIIENAVKYTPAGTPITVSAHHKVDNKGDNIEVVVKDSGPGVAPEHLPHLFDKFYRVDRSDRTKGRGGSEGRSGIGLGLSITKGLVAAHGGHIQAANRPEGGLRVTFGIPVNGAPQPAGNRPEATTVGA
jgi:two-component system, OmpR family, sensor histidine kinase KdpD